MSATFDRLGSVEQKVHEHLVDLPQIAVNGRQFSQMTDDGNSLRPIETDDRPALERLAASILRASFAASRLQYDPEQGRIEYRTGKGLHPGPGQGRLPGPGLGGALSRRALLPAAAAQLGEVAAQGL